MRITSSHKFAKTLRQSMTDAEKIVWSLLRRKALGCKFRRQHPVDQYIVDFICIHHSLIIEIDGGHHNEEADHIRTDHLKKRGYKILRFWNNEVLQNREGVYEMIDRTIRGDNCEIPLPNPLPERERE